MNKAEQQAAEIEVNRSWAKRTRNEADQLRRRVIQMTSIDCRQELADALGLLGTLTSVVGDLVDNQWPLTEMHLIDNQWPPLIELFDIASGTPPTLPRWIRGLPNSEGLWLIEQTNGDREAAEVYVTEHSVTGKLYYRIVYGGCSDQLHDTCLSVERSFGPIQQ